MTVRLDEAEIASVLAQAHTGILATLRSDGSPAVMPLWFVMLDDGVCLRTPARSAKVGQIRRDPRVSFMVESGAAWAELKAVILYGRAEIVDEAAHAAAVDALWQAKYAGYGIPSGTPARTREHYATDRTYIRIAPTRPALTWDNAKLLA